MNEIVDVEVRHASPAVERRVKAWFLSQFKGAAADGNRSIHLPHPERPGYALKIKGAGYNAGPIRFGTYSRTGPAALAFDFEGRAASDVASGHDNAYLGGASFQQAVTEYNVSRLLADRGVAVVPCLGYGRVATKDHTAWFSLFDWHRGWSSISVAEAGSVQAYLESAARLAGEMLRLAIEHELIGYCGLVRAAEGQYLLKDLHPFRRADPITMSQLSWVMQVIFALNIRCRATQLFTAAAQDAPADAISRSLRAVLPDASQADYEALRARIVKPYMTLPLQSFDPRALFQALRDTRVGGALLELCPSRYTRW
ncbi:MULTISPECIES: hypothetical protein [unclassified Mesorhizobium]|uniref:hypothetical protein n=1 Tax=unclassified Mesorhizobium TaxID=325217 RepID=UPI000FCC2276|nr:MULTISPECIES: hypothetical protein [unclassified Mesorhizobium]TGP21953.1 hypothetical protein EN874_020975 [Mesorhizobium sp. M1D.F.Ca.ET.231.01.1.1]TGP30338.1 hypothetical protein EN877_19355 [Mesorhizobium sp. M1D.F.Ca.ET.234.01.1.1]TGS44414.1 hypothetical protein EN827_19350 [Mesorhizobium sp. M1D.F.Ca.ET.184.01.1.1]TGS60454.1 hypothetical protein EN826_019350 [Mesorhizobium sp. M1D.F.Ca.ET.183.01.1.1]